MHAGCCWRDMMLGSVHERSGIQWALDFALRLSERKSARCDCTLRLRVLSARSECALRHTLAARVRAALRVRNAANVALRERACLWPLEWHVSCCHNCNVDG